MLVNSDKWVCEPHHKMPLVLFVQRVRELLLHTTSLVNKPQFSSVFLLSREISFLTRQHKKSPHPGAQGQLELLLEELNHALGRDEVAKDFIGDRGDYIKKVLNSDEGADIKVEAAQLLRSRIARKEYLSESCRRIVEIVESGGKEKDRLVALTDCAVYAALDAGYPAQTIYHLLNVTFLNKNDGVNVTGRLTLEKFFSYFDLVFHRYSVILCLSDGPANLEKYIPSNMYSVHGFGGNDDFFQSIPARVKRFLGANGSPETIVRRLEIEALDPQSARAKAERDLVWLSELIQLKNHRFRISIKNEAVVYRQDKNEYINSNRPKPPIMRIPNDSDLTLSDVNEFVGRLKAVDVDSVSRYTRAVQLHSAAVKASEADSQLLNTWIALETLFLNSTADSKMARILRCVQPYIAVATLVYDSHELWSYIEKFHKPLWDKSIGDDERLKGFSGPLKVLALISILELKDLMTNFLSGLESDPLLRHKLWQRIKRGQGARHLKSYVESIERQVSHDLARIYRARNQIVHIGYSAADLNDIVQRAHHYLDIVLVVIETMLGRSGGVFSIEQATLEVEIIRNNLMARLLHGAKSDEKCNFDNFVSFNWGRSLLA